MHGAGQDTVLYLCEARQISLQMRATPLDAITIALPQLVYGGLFGVVALGILQTFRREAFEKIIDVFVVRSLALGLEAAGEEDLIDPVLFMANNAVFEQRAVDVETIIPFLAIPGINTTRVKIEHNLLHIAVDQDAPIDADAGQVGLFQQRLKPVMRSEEHTSELQSRSDLVCRL